MPNIIEILIVYFPIKNAAPVRGKFCKVGKTPVDDISLIAGDIGLSARIQTSSLMFPVQESIGIGIDGHIFSRGIVNDGGI
jgi:hypothetical protein